LDIDALVENVSATTGTEDAVVDTMGVPAALAEMQSMSTLVTSDEVTPETVSCVGPVGFSASRRLAADGDVIVVYEPGPRLGGGTADAALLKAAPASPTMPAVMSAARGSRDRAGM
jgi:hypothetical protein